MLGRWAAFNAIFVRKEMSDMQFAGPNTSSSRLRTRWTCSSLICTKTLPVSANNSRAIARRSRRYPRYECTPKVQVSRYAFTVSGSRVKSCSRSLTSECVRLGWKFER